MDDGETREVSLTASGDGNYAIELNHASAGESFPISASQIHEILDGRPIQSATSGGTCWAIPAGADILFRVAGTATVQFAIQGNQFGVLAKSLGLPPPPV